MEGKKMKRWSLVFFSLVIFNGCLSGQQRQTTFLETGKLPPTLQELNHLRMDQRVLQNLACNIGQCNNEKLAMRNLDVLFFYVRASQTVWEGGQFMQISMSIEATQPSRRHPKPLNLSAMAQAITEMERVLARCPKYRAAQKKYGQLSPPEDLAACTFDTYLLACYIKAIQ
jgi:hypothetical protein